MNAVERLLAQGEQVLALFDEMFRERLGSGRDPALPDVPPGLLYAVGGSVIEGMPSGCYWASAHWLQAATEAAWLEAKQAKKKPTTEEFAARASDLFRQYLSQREQLLSRETWRSLLADVVSESRAWEPLSEKVVDLAEQVAEAVQRVEQLSSDMEPARWRSETINLQSGKWSPAKRNGLRQALDSLHPYAQHPKPTGSAPGGKAGSSPRRAGRKQNDEALARDLLDGWRAYEPDEGRKTKDRYLAQRADVKTLKTPEARQRKIDSLLVALNSALHLKREKTKQKQRLRG